MTWGWVFTSSNLLLPRKLAPSVILVAHGVSKISLTFNKINRNEHCSNEKKSFAAHLIFINIK